ncbi:MAG: N-acetylneuraminate synthase [Spirochaetes bacterium]|nr:N-acetylneuraminate synthase [Spirochaetota bacterium]
MKVIVIAEIGVNHNGDIRLAKRLIDEAVNCGADYVKFQTFISEEEITNYATLAEYQKKNLESYKNQLEMAKKLELSFSEFIELKNYCELKNIKFLSSAFDIKSIEFLDKLGLDTFKIPSGEINNYPYLAKIGRFNKNIILSTGMSDLGEIEDAIDVLTSSGTQREKIILMHCNTEYPTPYEDVNLKAMLTIRDAFKVKVGYSDHTLGIEIPIAAVALGAEVIEKHFTLDKNLPGPDHKASLEPDELRLMIKCIRNVEAALGDGIKKPTKSELKNINIARKSIVASRDIKKGEIFSEMNITTKRPGYGINPMRWKEIIGKIASRDFERDEFIEL